MKYIKFNLDIGTLMRWADTRCVREGEMRHPDPRSVRIIRGRRKAIWDAGGGVVRDTEFLAQRVFSQKHKDGGEERHTGHTAYSTSTPRIALDSAKRRHEQKGRRGHFSVTQPWTRRPVSK